MRKRVLAWLLTAAVLVTLLPAAFADGEITSTNPPTTWADGTYTVPENANVSINQRVTVSGSVTLTLAAGCTLTVTGGIEVNAGSSLTINGTGELTADASGTSSAAGIGGTGGDGGTIIINGGSVTAKGGHWGAGIGGGDGGSGGGSGGTITITGGAVNASGGSYAAGIGGGSGTSSSGSGGGSGGTITITGGAVNASGGIYGAGIGGGSGTSSSGGNGGTITITGGAVEAVGGIQGAGIGGGAYGGGGAITINGGTVTAAGNLTAAAIGDGGLGGSGGTFHTENNGIAGSAFIVAAGSSDAAAISDISGKTSWSGVIFEGDAGEVYGSPALGTDAAIPTGKTLTIGSGKALTIGNNVTLTNEGTITNSGTLTNNGAIAVKTGGAITGNPVTGGGTLTYEVVVNGGAGSGDYAENAPVTITAAVPGGKRFINWTVDTGGAALADANSVTTTFSMPAQPVSVTAHFEIPTYAVTVQTDGNGTASASPAAAAAGTTVTLSAAPNAGYHFKQWQVVPGTVSVTGSSFTMPGENVTVTAIFEADPVQPAVHTHVWAGAWSRDASCHWHECVAPGCDISDNSQKDGYAAHTPGGWIVDFWPTASTPGQQHIECTVCGYVIQAAVLPATGGSTGGSSGSSSGGSSGGYTPPTYRPDVTPPGRGGSAAAVSPSRPERGDTVTVTPRPDEGYEVDKIAVTDRGGASVEVTQNPDGTFSFTQPGGSVTIEVTYRPAEQPWSSPFSDVSEGSWYREAVRFVQENGLMNGYSDGLFRPNDTLSRAQLAQILHNKEGRPGVNYLLTFSDVSGGAWYTEAIRWAASQRIVGGCGDGTFSPNAPISREQLAVMLWRYSGRPAAAGAELRFDDADKISGYALEAMRWAVENGILSGYGDGRLNPGGQATRGEAAQMLKAFLEAGEHS